MEEVKKEEPRREYKEERFEYAVYVNEFIICKRNFRISNFIDGSMETLEFKECVDGIVSMIDNDLKSKSRVYLWKFFNPDYPDAEEELVSPLIEPWSCTFKFAVYDNKKEVISRIWDGYAYPKYVREKVDLSNKYVRLTSKDGVTYTYDKESFFESNKDRLSFEQELLKGMIYDRPDLLSIITDKIRETCSIPRDEYKAKKKWEYSDVEDYLLKNFTTSEEYLNDEIGGGIEYSYAFKRDQKKYYDKVARQVSRKMKAEKPKK